VLDELVPGPVLAGFVAEAAENGQGLTGLGESELIGFLCASERMASWAAAQKAESVITLCRRRARQARERKNKHLIEHVADEVAAALTLTRRAANRLVPTETVAARGGSSGRVSSRGASQLRARTAAAGSVITDSAF
jgi:hypothetical protein